MAEFGLRPSIWDVPTNTNSGDTNGYSTPPAVIVHGKEQQPSPIVQNTARIYDLVEPNPLLGGPDKAQISYALNARGTGGSDDAGVFANAWSSFKVGVGKAFESTNAAFKEAYDTVTAPARNVGDYFKDFFSPTRIIVLVLFIALAFFFLRFAAARAVGVKT